MRGCLIATVVLQRSDRIKVNRLPASPHCGEFEYIIMVARDRRDVWWVTTRRCSDTNRARRLDKDKNSRIAAQRPSEKTAGLRKCMSVCERNKKQELNTLDETDFVRDVCERNKKQELNTLDETDFVRDVCERNKKQELN